MKSEDKKSMINAYKEREITGGIYSVKNNMTGKMLIESTLDVSGSKNRFEFSKNTGSAVSLKLQKDFTQYGADSFSFEILETLKKSETQTLPEFEADIKLLKEMWLEKFDKILLY